MAAYFFEDILEDILIEILKRLPVSSLIKVMLVQKSCDLFLCNAHYSDTDSDNRSVLDLWKLEKAGIKDVWGEKISIDLQKVGKGERRWFPQCLRNNNELILMYFDDTHGFGCTSYDIEKRESTVIIDDPSDLYSALDVACVAYPRPIKASFFAENLGLLGDNSNLNLVTKW
ncbi:hypothetical protein POM88_031884 [Heracleum sosnowskyi]|uniref:F-box domain-containing protein n=1 Tax=Heracleum sosnowskyi TaxID=360622 RepID=A0AAD8MJI1_9APIA|nr:hypothetical protein POM88_031884 [Heracleum sosnowskyi]